MLFNRTVSVRLYFPKSGAVTENGLEYVRRSIRHTNNDADAALRALFEGPTEAEKSTGFSDPFETARGSKPQLKELYRGVTVSNEGSAMVDFSSGAGAYLLLPAGTIINNKPATGFSHAIIVPILETLKQFPSVKFVNYSLDGNIVEEFID
jgi:spore germination protein GerM